VHFRVRVGFCAPEGIQTFLTEILMKPSTIETLVPAINVLAGVMTQTSDNYQQLLHQPQAYAACREAGRSLRCLTDRYARVLVAVFDDRSEVYAEDDDFDDMDDALSEEDVAPDE
jgi:hypothetical protein